MPRKFCSIFLCAVFIFSFSVEGIGQESTDPELQTFDYKLPAKIHEDIIDDRETELWARVYYPDEMETPRPLIVFLHGNHATCSRGSNPRRDSSCYYTIHGSCPDGFQVVNNHLGYEYIMPKLVEQGFVIVSINANRGINCGEGLENDWGLNLNRGNLILKHLELLSQWSKGGDLLPPELEEHRSLLLSRINFKKVGLVGHSRGGEGVRAALNLYRDPRNSWRQSIGEIDIRAIYEIAPVDGQTGRILNPENVAWNVIVPACDGDVWTLEGLKVYDRLLDGFITESRPTPKSTLLAWGTNHNYFNTEWNQSDSASCRDHVPIFPSYGDSPQQKEIGKITISDFFSRYLNGNDESGKYFDSTQPVPQQLAEITQFDRNHIPAAVYGREHYKQFLLWFGHINDGSWWNDLEVETNNVDWEHDHVKGHSPLVQGAHLKWDSSDEIQYIKYLWAPETDDTAKATEGSKYIDFRIAQLEKLTPEVLNFSIKLIFENFEESAPVKLNNYNKIFGPANMQSFLQTVRIPIEDFLVENRKIRGVRFVFNETLKGKLVISHMRLRNEYQLSQIEDYFRQNLGESQNVNLLTPLNSLLSENFLSPVPQVSAAEDSFAQIEEQQMLDEKVLVRFKSNRSFLPGPGVLLLRVGRKVYATAQRPDDGSLSQLNFVIDSIDRDLLEEGYIYYSSKPSAAWKIQ